MNKAADLFTWAEIEFADAVSKTSFERTISKLKLRYALGYASFPISHPPPQLTTPLGS